MVNHSVVKIFTSQMSISSNGPYLINIIFIGHNRRIQFSSTKIKDQYIAVFFFLLQIDFILKTISQSNNCCSIYNSKNVQASNVSSILDRLSLRIIETGRYGYNSIYNSLPKVSLSHLLHLFQDQGYDFLWGKCFGFIFEFNFQLRFLVFIIPGHFKRPMF